MNKRSCNDCPKSARKFCRRNSISKYSSVCDMVKRGKIDEVRIKLKGV